MDAVQPTAGRFDERSGGARYAAVGALVAGAVFWVAMAFNDDADLPLGWIVAVPLVALVPVVLTRQRLAVKLLWVLAIAAPIVAVGGLGLLYAFGDGIDNGEGGSESFATMLPVVIMGSSLAISMPSVVVAGVLAARMPPR